MAPDTWTREFGFSETNIRKANRTLIALIVFSLFFGGAFAWYFGDFGIGKAVIAVGKALIMLGPILAVEAILLSRRSRKLKVLTYDDKLAKQCAKKQHILLWNDIVRIKTVHTKSGAVAQMWLYPEKPKTPMYLYGYRDMEDLANLIRERTPEGVVLGEKRWKLDWQDPWVAMLVLGVPTVAAIFIIASMGGKAMDIFAIVAALSVALLLLVSRPLTKSDLGLKWIELIAGIGLLALGIYMLICLLTMGRAG